MVQFCMSENLFNYAIALTGGIATGKSTVCELLRQEGYKIIDADKIAHKLLDKNATKIASIFGKQYIKDGKVLRKELGKIIFSNETNKLKLEALLHPQIKSDIEDISKEYESQKSLYFIDLPLFFEKTKYPISTVVLVYTPKHIQIQRLQKRDNISKEEALLKISNQMDIEEKKELADFIIDNSKDEIHLKKEIKKLLESLNGLYKV